MLLLTIPIIWSGFWAAMALAICALLGISSSNPYLWWYMAGIFLAGDILLPAVFIGLILLIKKWRKRIQNKAESGI